MRPRPPFLDIAGDLLLNNKRIIKGVRIMKTNHYLIGVSVLLGINLCFAVNAFCKDISRGEAVYRSNCIMCHLIRSENPPLSTYYKEHQPKDFTTALGSRNLSEDKIKSVLNEGQGIMRPVRLSQEDYKALVDYMINVLKKQSK